MAGEQQLTVTGKNKQTNKRVTIMNNKYTARKKRGTHLLLLLVSTPVLATATVSSVVTAEPQSTNPATTARVRTHLHSPRVDVCMFTACKTERPCASLSPCCSSVSRRPAQLARDGPDPAKKKNASWNRSTRWETEADAQSTEKEVAAGRRLLS